jgi:hypothetical protein
VLNIGVSAEASLCRIGQVLLLPAEPQSFFLALAPPVGKGIIISAERKRIRIKEECANLAGGLFWREWRNVPKVAPLFWCVHIGLVLIGQVEK